MSTCVVTKPSSKQASEPQIDTDQAACSESGSALGLGHRPALGPSTKSLAADQCQLGGPRTYLKRSTGRGMKQKKKTP